MHLGIISLSVTKNLFSSNRCSSNLNPGNCKRLISASISFCMFHEFGHHIPFTLCLPSYHSGSSLFNSYCLVIPPVPARSKASYFTCVEWERKLLRWHLHIHFFQRDLCILTDSLDRRPNIPGPRDVLSCCSTVTPNTLQA